MTERRKATPTPVNAMERGLSELQLISVRQLQNFGCELQFVRQPLFLEPVAVVFGSDNEVMTVDIDGNVDDNPDIVIRQ